MNETTQTRRSDSTAERMQRRPTVNPLVDIYENADEILLVADIPGVTRDQIRVDLEKNQLTLTARRDDDTKGRLLGQEWKSRDYYRVFMVPQGIDAEKISAELTDGVLRVHLPKVAAAKPRKIEVRVSSGQTS